MNLFVRFLNNNSLDKRFFNIDFYCNFFVILLVFQSLMVVVV